MYCKQFLLLLIVISYISLSKPKKTKDSRCHMLMSPGCDVSLYKILDYEEAGYFYHAPFKSCRPFYANKAGSLCAMNRDLPMTKEECEEICGERCLLPGGKSGICMMEGSCSVKKPATWDPRPCHAYNVQCCPQK